MSRSTLVAVIAGLIGGLIGSQVGKLNTASAQPLRNVLTAQELDIVDDAGKP